VNVLWFFHLYILDYLLYYALSVVALSFDCYLRNELQHTACALSRIEVADIDDPQVQCVAQDGQQHSGFFNIYGCTKMIFLAGNTMSKVPWFGTRYADSMPTATLPCFTFSQLMEQCRFAPCLVSVTSKGWIRHLLHVQTAIAITTRVEHSCLPSDTS
jgi:hypothetical protein